MIFIDRLRRVVEARRRQKREAALSRAIESYGRERLALIGLQPPPETRLIGRKKNRRVLADGRRVWKFYRAGQAHYALNFAAAARRLAEAGLGSPVVEFLDASGETRRRYGLCCLVMPRVPGEAPRSPMTSEDEGRLAAFLAGLHQVRSTRWGDCHDPADGSYAEAIFQLEVERELAFVAPRLVRLGLGPLPDVLGWFGRRLEGLNPLEGAFHFVSADAHPNNFLIRPDGSLCLIDLDRARFLDFPLDLARMIVSLHPSALEQQTGQAEATLLGWETQASALLRGYFGTAPPEFRRHWERARRAYFLRLFIRDLWNALKHLEPKWARFQKKPAAEYVGQAGRLTRLIGLFAAEP